MRSASGNRKKPCEKRQDHVKNGGPAHLPVVEETHGEGRAAVVQELQPDDLGKHGELVSVTKVP